MRDNNEIRISLWDTLRELSWRDYPNLIVLLLLFAVWEFSFVHPKKVLIAVIIGTFLWVFRQKFF